MDLLDQIDNKASQNTKVFFNFISLETFITTTNKNNCNKCNPTTLING